MTIEVNESVECRYQISGSTIGASHRRLIYCNDLCSPKINEDTFFAGQLDYDNSSIPICDFMPNVPVCLVNINGVVSDTGSANALRNYSNSERIEYVLSEQKKREFTIINAIYPNPFQNEITIDLTSPLDGIWKINMTMSTGQSILQKDFSLLQGNSQMKLTFENKLPSGVYYIHLSNESGHQEVHLLVHQ